MDDHIDFGAVVRSTLPPAKERVVEKKVYVDKIVYKPAPTPPGPLYKVTVTEQSWSDVSASKAAELANKIVSIGLVYYTVERTR